MRRVVMTWKLPNGVEFWKAVDVPIAPNLQVISPAHASFGHYELLLRILPLEPEVLSIDWRRYDWIKENHGFLGDVKSGHELSVPEHGPVRFQWDCGTSAVVG